MDPESCRRGKEDRSKQLWDEITTVFHQWEAGDGTLATVECTAQLGMNNALAMTDPETTG